ncbi:MAG: hypothetical protein ACOC54_01105 [Candidatus Sumerlaeota bacterium]
MMQDDKAKNPWGVRKQVGRLREENPLRRAWRLRQMTIELYGEQEDPDHAHIRKLVGRTCPKKD